MEIISLARLAYKRGALDEALLDHLWRSYWSGAPEFTIDVPAVDVRDREILRVDAIWELLIDGRLDLDRSWRLANCH